MNEAEVAKLTDDQVLAMAAGMGPAIIGEALFKRAQEIQKKNPEGKLGPAILGTPEKPKPDTSGPDPDKEPVLPSIPKLAEYIKDLGRVEVEALMESDARKTAAPIYEARLEELAE
jgi:hypothetical protein